MAIPAEHILATLPPEERATIEKRAEELRCEYKTLQDLRRARQLTQERLAELLVVGQDSVSRLEQRSDLLLSTLRSYVAAMGGRLRLTVEFPDRPPVDLSSLSGEQQDDSGRSRRGPAARQRKNQPAS